MTKAPPRKKKQPSPKQASPGFQRKFWIGMCVVSSAWMFFFGLMVGRGTIPSQFDIPKLERKLADLAQPDEKPEAESERKIIPQPDIPAPDLFEVLKARDPVLDMPDDKPTDKPTAVSSKGPMKTKRPPTMLKKKKRKQTATAEKPKTSPAPSTPSVPIKKARLVVQAAAYKDLDAANEAVAALQQLGYRAYVASVEIEGKGIWHRVRLGPYDTKANAERMVQRLKEKKIDGYIIQ